MSAWGNGTFPLASIPAILGGAMVIVIVVEQAGVKLPEPVLTFTWRQVRFTWATVAAGDHALLPRSWTREGRP